LSFKHQYHYFAMVYVTCISYSFKSWGTLPIMDYMGMLRPKWVSFSGWKLVGKGSLFRLEVWERGTFLGKRMWNGPDFPKFSMWKGRGPQAEHSRMKSIGVPPSPQVGLLKSTSYWRNFYLFCQPLFPKWILKCLCDSKLLKTIFVSLNNWYILVTYTN